MRCFAVTLALWLLAGTGTAGAQNPCFASPGKSHIVQISPLVAVGGCRQRGAAHSVAPVSEERDLLRRPRAESPGIW